MKHAIVSHSLIKGSLALALLMSVSGCSDMKQRFGVDPTAPDEFAVDSRPPLTVPPHFSLPAPQQSQSSTLSSAKSPEEILSASKKGHHSESKNASVQELLKAAGSQNADQNIRSTVDQSADEKEKSQKTVFGDMIPWQKKARDNKETLDPIKEKKRLDEEQKNKKSTPSNTEEKA